MLTNAMGPILNVYLLSVVQLSPTAYIGTRAMFFCFLNVGKIPMRFAAGTLGAVVGMRQLPGVKKPADAYDSLVDMVLAL